MTTLGILVITLAFAFSTYFVTLSWKYALLSAVVYVGLLVFVNAMFFLVSSASKRWKKQ